ncbi:sugar ABC transporter substrate-binding protein [Paenibacillus alkaliterrae]|uniref:ABC transporter substrate-binding protein n=1 Tax=Paenibacillus alkaliterrae TaxID=320909 RepID=UPI001F292CED|nr:sugar ABC transporter substrate-binding protein [Paenibacillus alkaliterrae]MCF2939687.1 sugar ABC transporter substrate-binding protein [Paenibacillus alkaliterrae]
MRVKYRTIAMMTAMCVMIITGCMKGEGHLTDNKGRIDHVAAEKTVTLTFWRNSGNNAENTAYEQLTAAFMKKHPTIKIEMTPFPYSDYDTKLRTSVAAGNPPDIMAVDAPNLASYAQAGALIPLTEHFKKDGNLEDIPLTTIEGYTYKNDIYLAPMTESSIAMFYNKKMFEAAGIPLPSRNPDEAWTWGQVLEAAVKINDPANGIYGIDPAQGFQNAGATAYFKYPIIWQFGGDVMNAEGTTARGFLDSPETKRALTFYTELFTKYKVASFEYPVDAFPNRKLGITIDGTWTLSHIAEKFPDFKLGEDFDVAPLPKGSRQAVANGSWALGISTKSKHPEEAWLFVNWMTGYEGLKLYSSVTKDIPARYSVAKEFTELNEYPKNIFVIQNQKYGRPRPITPVFPQVSEAVKNLFVEVTLEKRNLDEAIDDAISTIDKAYADSKSIAN